MTKKFLGSFGHLARSYPSRVEVSSLCWKSRHGGVPIQPVIDDLEIRNGNFSHISRSMQTWPGKSFLGSHPTVILCNLGATGGGERRRSGVKSAQPPHISE